MTGAQPGGGADTAFYVVVADLLLSCVAMVSGAHARVWPRGRYCIQSCGLAVPLPPRVLQGMAAELQRARAVAAMDAPSARGAMISVYLFLSTVVRIACTYVAANGMVSG